MTKEITKAFIIQQIQDKFKLREFEPAPFVFSETVLPTYDIGPHLIEQKTILEEKIVSSAPTGLKFHTVPENEKWKVFGYNVIFMAAGAYTVTGLFIVRASGSPTHFMYLDMTAGQAVSYAKNLPQPVILEPGDSVHMYVDSYTSTADLRVYLNVASEEIR